MYAAILHYLDVKQSHDSQNYNGRVKSQYMDDYEVDWVYECSILMKFQ